MIQELLDFEASCSDNSSVFCGRMVISGGCTLHSEVISLLSSQLDVIQVSVCSECECAFVGVCVQ